MRRHIVTHRPSSDQMKLAAARWRSGYVDAVSGPRLVAVRQMHTNSLPNRKGHKCEGNAFFHDNRGERLDCMASFSVATRAVGDVASLVLALHVGELVSLSMIANLASGRDVGVRVSGPVRQMAARLYGLNRRALAGVLDAGLVRLAQHYEEEDSALAPAPMSEADIKEIVAGARAVTAMQRAA